MPKRIRDARWFHKSALPSDLQRLAHDAEQAMGLHPAQWNVLKTRGEMVSLLRYERFRADPFPALAESWTLDTVTGQRVHRDHRGENPPVLHRKELLLSPGDPQRERAARITRKAEKAGLFEDPAVIGRKRSWERLLREKRFDPRKNPAQQCALPVERHRTAIARSDLSAPLKAIQALGLLSGTRTVLDYGCGRGDDLQRLARMGVRCWGFDPHFAPDGRKTPADIVNLGFVLNVIEDPRERAAVLADARSLAKEFLVVSTLVDKPPSRSSKRCGDGIVTSRETFQRSFRHEELGRYIESVLGLRARPIGRGIFLVGCKV